MKWKRADVFRFLQGNQSTKHGVWVEKRRAGQQQYVYTRITKQERFVFLFSNSLTFTFFPISIESTIPSQLTTPNFYLRSLPFPFPSLPFIKPSRFPPNFPSGKKSKLGSNERSVFSIFFFGGFLCCCCFISFL